jgi:hypothetical protein
MRDFDLRHLLPTFRLVSPVIFFIVFPASGFVSLLYMERAGTDANQTFLIQRKRRFLLAWGLIPVALLSILWFPGRSYRVAHPKDTQSLIIRVNRSECFGACPTYAITIHGNGSVNYSGIHNVGVSGDQSGTIQPDQLMAVLQEFDNVRFFSLETKAFERCTDTPKVSVFISVDGREKEVSSDAFCVGANSAPQAQFVRLAQQIDEAVGSDRWVRCGHSCPL